MCGIAGMAGQGIDKKVVEEMCYILSHRGPDDAGIFADSQVVLGHRRLSIIDLAAGHQPMSNEDETIWVIFNGEIYNFKDLRRALEGKGHHFKTKSDTEVLPHAYEEYGVSFLNYLDGIFALALWDAKDKQLLLARDLFGVKPLHFFFNGQTLWFASESKALLLDRRIPRRVDCQALHYFLNLRYIPGKRTLFEGIHRLLPAQYLLYREEKIVLQRYYQLPKRDCSKKKASEYQEGIRHYLRKAICKQKISDVPLGIYLSGGLDSSALVAFMHDISKDPIQTFCIGFDEPTDELADAQLVAERFHTKHHDAIVQPSPLQCFPEVIWHVEEPKENILQGYLLAKFASQSVKVALSGLGGDELFAGYVLNRYLYPLEKLSCFIPAIFSERVLQPLGRGAFRLNRAMGMLNTDEVRRGVQLGCSLGHLDRAYLILRNVWDENPEVFEDIYGTAFSSQLFSLTAKEFESFFKEGGRVGIEEIHRAEFHTKLVDDFLMNEDRVSMAHGLEVRVPFLDRELVEFAFSIPAHEKIKWNKTKHLYRNTMRGILPDAILKKKKWGFSFNPYYQFQKDLKKVAERVLTKERVENRGWFRYTYIRRILDHPPHPRLRWHYFFLWIILGLEIWCQMFLEGDLQNPELSLEAYFG